MERLSQFNIRLYLSYLESFIQFILSTLGNIHTTITGIVIGCLLTTAFTLRKVLNIRNYLLQKSIFLELTPPAFTEKTAYTTQQLFSVLHNIGSQRTIVDKFLGRKKYFSLEIVSTKDQGI